jgi:hypothetical protein
VVNAELFLVGVHAARLRLPAGRVKDQPAGSSRRLWAGERATARINARGIYRFG